MDSLCSNLGFSKVFIMVETFAMAKLVFFRMSGFVHPLIGSRDGSRRGRSDLAGKVA